MGYNSKYTGAEVDNALGKALTAIQEHQDISGKQDVISDLSEIRSNAKKGATAAEACAAYTFPNGKKGYLPAIGEWNLAIQNSEQINSAMSLVGGSVTTTGYIWSSTLGSATKTWRVYWSSKTISSSARNTNTAFAIAFTTV